MKRAAIGLVALLIAITAIAATQYGRVQLTATATLDHATRGVQYVAHDLSPISPNACASGDRILCWDAAAGAFMIGLGTWTVNDVKVMSGAFGLVNVELQTVTVDRIICDDGGAFICDFVNISMHPSRNEWCHAPLLGPWQLAAADAGCVNFWDMSAGEVAAGTWALAPSDGVATGYLGGGPPPDLTYGDTTCAVACYTAVYDAAGDLVHEAPVAGGQQNATSGTTTHAWVEIALDLSGLAAGSADLGLQTMTIYIVFNGP
jgi:hypothetical protein